MPEPPELPVLTAEEQRVLGSLLEKQATVPASYPLSANALRTACNQTSNRDPVVEYDEPTITGVTRTLKERGLLRIVWSDTGRRTLKYHQLLDEQLGLDAEERALLTVLLLRGPQAPGELRTRTERLHGFPHRDDVEACLRRMAGREHPLVRELEKRPGQHDRRWAHLLGPAPESAPSGAVDRDAVLAEGVEVRDAKVRASYDTVAATYADRFVDELADMEFERWLLDRVATHAAGSPVVEVGSGPGHVTAHLAGRGAAATGIDLSPAMVEEARRRFPDVPFEVGDLRRLGRPTSAPGWAAVVAWFSLVHSAPAELPDIVRALLRPLDPGGWLVLAVLAGSEVRHRTEWMGHPIDLDAVLHEPATVVGVVEGAGLEDVEWYLRGPVAGRGETNQRLYVVGRSSRS